MRTGEASKTFRERIKVVRERQRSRFSGINGVSSNDGMHSGEVRKFCDLDSTCTNLMKTARAELQLSARAYHRVLKLAQTIADLAGSERIAASHLAEVLQYRPRLTTDYSALLCRIIRCQRPLQEAAKRLR